MVRKIKSDTAQVTPISTVIMLMIIVSLVLVTYTWGYNLLQVQKDRVATTYMQSKMVSIKNSIIEVAHEKIDSSRVVYVNLQAGNLKVRNGDYCSGSSVNLNGLIYETSLDFELIDSGEWILIDPVEDNMSCAVDYTKNGAGVLLGRALESGTSYLNQYFLWFRALNDTSTGNVYVINITEGNVSAAGGTTTTLVVRNVGSVTSGSTVTTNVRIDFY